MIDDAYRDKIRNAAWLAIVEASMTTGPDGTKVAVLKSGEIIEALLWLQDDHPRRIDLGRASPLQRSNRETAASTHAGHAARGRGIVV
jgi:hypothetical protein